ncbi:MAG: Prepilin-type N-terminal cleavage/methylation domain-containing protein [Microgenomates bacterium 39_7]|nr:MAG: Prepilin-type N-terminal cleavage/methylation domain-containing protein [Microgenomates bacterium 39_7]
MTLNMKKTLSSKSGFTMIELLVVATIIILLTTIGLVSYRQASISSRNGKRKADLETVRQALVMYRSEQGSYPTTNDFDVMIGILKAEGFLSDDSTVFTDPGQNTYLYSGGGTSFTLTATLEPSGTYELKNP